MSIQIDNKHLFNSQDIHICIPLFRESVDY